VTYSRQIAILRNKDKDNNNKKENEKKNEKEQA
jgi:hypothetical protein